MSDVLAGERWTESAPLIGVPSARERRRAGRFAALMARHEALTSTAVLLLHAALGLAMYHSKAVAAAQGMAAMVAACLIALYTTPAGAVAAAAYLAGSDVLWRVCSAPLPYEGGKYAVAVTCFVALLRLGRRARWKPVPIFYMLAQLPSTLATFTEPLSKESTAYRAGLLRAYLSGPLSLAMTAWLCAHVQLGSKEFRRVLLAFVAPTVSVVAITLLSTYTATDINFTGESNFVTSGGFGPNQVSTSLGLGAMLAMLGVIRPDSPFLVRGLMLVTALLSAMQSAMTFSRGGIYGALGALAVGTLYFLQSARTRRALVVAGAAAAVITSVVVFPRLNAFTGGALETRFESTDTTNRGTLMLDDVRIWLEHPILGVGPGMAREYRAEGAGAGHTEFTRELAEHGIFGAVAVALLGVMAIGTLVGRRPHSAVDQGTRVKLFAWGALAMVHAAMRLSVVGFTIGLSQALIDNGHRSDEPR